jgi:hypothetical protein
LDSIHQASYELDTQIHLSYAYSHTLNRNVWRTTAISVTDIMLGLVPTS